MPDLLFVPERLDKLINGKKMQYLTEVVFDNTYIPGSWFWWFLQYTPAMKRFKVWHCYSVNSLPTALSKIRETLHWRRLR